MKFLLDQDVYALKVLETYSEDELARSFVVVEKNRHRIRRIE
jgi:hypothetical protein